MPRIVGPTAIALGLLLPAGASSQSITLYEHVDFGGKSRTITGATARLDQPWNDQASSIRIAGGAWELCRHYDFVDCHLFDADVADLRPTGWNDAVSSLRPVGAASPLPSSSGAGSSGTAAPRPTAAPSHVKAADFAGQPAQVNGYLDYRKPDGLIVEGQRLVTSSKTRFHGSGEARSVDSIPLGYQVEASGVRLADGSIQAATLDAKPNGEQMFESDVKHATDQLEAVWRKNGEMLTATGDGKTASMGKLHESGPEYDRAKGIVDRLLPPYIPQESARVYVVDNDEWNAMAMGNYSIYVFTGIMRDFDDDELALVIGHELTHASHEHSRKQQKRGLWTGIAATGAQVLVGTQLEGGEREAASILTGLGAAAFANGYSRDQEDQADRVGMRYAYEAGYDVSKGPEVWQRFAEKYGDSGKAQNILFGDHSRASVRAKALEREIALNYATNYAAK